MEILHLEEDESMDYYLAINRKLFNVIWKSTRKEARTLIEAYFDSGDGRRALLTLNVGTEADGRNNTIRVRKPVICRTVVGVGRSSLHILRRLG